MQFRNRWINNYDSVIETNNIVNDKQTMFVKKITVEKKTNGEDIPEHYILYGKPCLNGLLSTLNYHLKNQA